MKRITLGILIILLITTVGYSDQQPKSKLPDYKALAKKCKKKLSPGCCMASVKAMEEGKYIQDMGDTFTNTTCPEGFQPSMMKCPDSYRWCIPEIKKNKKIKTK